MMRWHLIIIAVVVGLVAFQSMANDSEATTEITGDMKKITYPPKDKFDMSVLQATVDKHLNQIKTHLKSVAALMKWRSVEAQSEVFLLKFFAQHPYIEDATNIRRTWYKKLAKALGPLAQTKTLVKVYGERNMDTSQLEKQCLAEAKKFIAILKKPELVKKKPAPKRRRR